MHYSFGSCCLPIASFAYGGIGEQTIYLHMGNLELYDQDFNGKIQDYYAKKSEPPFSVLGSTHIDGTKRLIQLVLHSHTTKEAYLLEMYKRENIISVQGDYEGFLQLVPYQKTVDELQITTDKQFLYYYLNQSIIETLSLSAYLSKEDDFGNKQIKTPPKLVELV